MKGQGTVKFDFILFGATGNLAMRKIFPSLFQAYRDHLLHKEGRIIATGRTRYSRDEFLQHLKSRSIPHMKAYDKEALEEFLTHIEYLPLDIAHAPSFEALKQKVREDVKNVVIYFSISPEFFIQACKHLASVGLNDASVRIVLEKPLGVDLSSCVAIHETIGQYYKEEQIYRIDHYLGKESVQNLLFLRLHNPFLEAFWHKDYIKNVQITVFEQLGIEARGEFYDHMGALRDMLQNHMLQMLCLLAMEKPDHFDNESIRKQKLKLLKSLKPMQPSEIPSKVVRAQYAQSAEFKGYLQEHKIPPNSQTETFVALKLEIDNDRWAGVPFYLRTGKRMVESFVEIVLVFKEDHTFLGKTHNRLVIRLQPEAFMRLYVNIKGAGRVAQCQEGYLSLDFFKNSKPMQAYERLILDVIDAIPTSFNHRDELEVAWEWLMPILENWRFDHAPLYTYSAGTDGPQEAHDLLRKNDDIWM